MHIYYLIIIAYLLLYIIYCCIIRVAQAGSPYLKHKTFYFHITQNVHRNIFKLCKFHLIKKKLIHLISLRNTRLNIFL